MEELLRKTRKVFALHSVVSLLLLVPYFTFLEVFLHPAPINYETSSALLSRPLTHSLPLLLLLLSLLSNVVYLHQAKLGRDAARAWNSLAQPPSPTPVSPACAPSLSPPPSPSRPMNAGDVLSAHISRGGGPPSPEAPSPLPPLVYPPLQPSAPLEEVSSRLPLPPGNRRCGHLDCVTCAFLQQVFKLLVFYFHPLTFTCLKHGITPLQSKTLSFGIFKDYSSSDIFYLFSKNSFPNHTLFNLQMLKFSRDLDSSRR